MKKIRAFLSSMKFAVTLLVLLAAACALSSLVEQGLTQEQYGVLYGSFLAGVISVLHLEDAYHSWWFLLLSGLLCLNLILCSCLKFPSFLRRFRAEKDTEAAMKGPGDLGEWETAEPETVFAAIRMPASVSCKTADGREARYTHRNAAGVWGPWICHVGILLLIAGFALGQITQKQITVWGIPGETREMAETGFLVTFDDFRVETREDGSVQQYVTEMTLQDPKTGRQEKVSASVNHPAAFGGYQFSQNNTGYAVRATVIRGGEEIQRKTLLPGGTMEESVMGLAEQPAYAFYFVGARAAETENGEKAMIGSYQLYYNGQLREQYMFLNEGTVTLEECEITFTPAAFTLLVARRDAFSGLVLAGGLLTLAGLFLAFYWRPAALWAIREEDGCWRVRGRCRKGNVVMREQLSGLMSKAEDGARTGIGEEAQKHAEC